MPTFSTITVADATPANHDFVPSKVDGNLANYLEKSAASSNGYWPLAVSVRPPAGQQEVYRARLTLAIPVLVTETINGVNRSKVERVLRYNVEQISHESSTGDEREDGLTILANLLGHADILSVFKDLENVY